MIFTKLQLQFSDDSDGDWLYRYFTFSITLQGDPAGQQERSGLDLRCSIILLGHSVAMVEIDRKRYRNAWAAAERAEIFWPKEPSRQPDRPTVLSVDLYK